MTRRGFLSKTAAGMSAMILAVIGRLAHGQAEEPAGEGKTEIYKCGKCGNIVGILHKGMGKPTCCGQPMERLSEQTEDVGWEKHVPVVEKTPDGIKVKVGSMPHPMLKEHYIEWIEIIVDGRSCWQFLKPGDAPEAVFNVSASGVTARAYCNLHGLWKGA